jgi:stringent starvation protein B
MTSNRPYLIRALFDWILDNDMTPHLLVDAEHPGSFVPQEFVEEGRIVLNVAPGAVKDLVMSNDSISFSARFGGVARQVELPPRAVIGIYARENGHGMLFPDEEPATESTPDGGPGDDGDGGSKSEKPVRPALRVVK